MEKIFLNLKETDSCCGSGGHRTSDGWVHDYRVATVYSLTSSSSDAMIPLKACCIFDLIFSKYTSSSDFENDRYCNIDEYCHIRNVDISDQIKQLNEVQCKYEFIQTTESLEFDANIMIINSRREDSKANKIIHECNAELSRQIRVLQEKNRQVILAKIFPHIRNLIIEDQLDFFSKDEKTGKYPLDLLAINNEYELLITSILRYKKIPFEKFNEVYTLLTTGTIPYLDILNGTVKNLNDSENHVLSEFLRDMEKRYRHDNYDSILSSFSNSNIAGLCNLFGHLLNRIGVDKCYEMINWWEYSELPENKKSVFSFHARYLFPYFIIVLLAVKDDLTATSFFEKYRYESGFNDIPFILDRHGIYFNQLIPYFKMILQNPNAVEILALILHRSNIEQYNRDRIKNREILSCMSNEGKCVEFIKKTLQEFISNE